MTDGKELGDTILCDKCGKLHVIQWEGGGKDKRKQSTLQFYKCGALTRLAGINGKRIRQ